MLDPAFISCENITYYWITVCSHASNKDAETPSVIGILM
jgi:hypothetical protein